MVGILNTNQIIEYQDEDALSKSLQQFGRLYNADTIFIVDMSNLIKGIIYEDQFIFIHNLSENVRYKLYGISGKYITFNYNDELPEDINWQFENILFYYIDKQNIPIQIDYK